MTIFVFVFGLIYENFSHGVTSYYMLLAFMIPFAGYIVAVLAFMANKKKNGILPRLIEELIAGATCWLTLGSIFKGVLEIYGTTNHLCGFFLAIGLLQLAAAGVMEIVLIEINKK